MTKISDIEKERDRACDIIQDQINSATRMQNSGAQNLDDKITALTQKQADIAAQAYAAALDDPAMTAALAALQGATKKMTDTAAKMTTATAFIGNFNTFLAAANGIIPILQGTGTTA